MLNTKSVKDPSPPPQSSPGRATPLRASSFREAGTSGAVLSPYIRHHGGPPSPAGVRR